MEGTDALLRAASACSPAALAIFDRDLRCAFANEAFALLAGRPVTDLEGLSHEDLAGTEALDALRPMIDNVAATWEPVEDLRVSLRMPGPAGLTRDWRIDARPIAVDDGMAGVAVVAEDETARNRTERSLRASEARLRMVVDNSFDLIILVDRQARILYASRSCERMLGFRPDDLLTTSAFDYVHPDDRAVAEEQYRRMAERGQLETVSELRLRHAAGHWVYVESAGRTVLDTSGEPGIAIVFAHDITERKRAEEARAESESLLRTMLDGSWEPMVLHDEGRILEVNAAFCRIVGYGRDELLGEQLFSFVAPEDRARLLGQLPAEATDFSIVSRDGRRRAIRGVGRDVTYQGRTIRLATGRDVTELRESEERYRSLVEGVDAIVWEADPENDIVRYMSPRVEEALGYPPEALQQAGFVGDVLHPDDREWVEARYLEILEHWRDDSAEYRVIAADGSVQWIRDRVHATVDRDTGRRLLRGISTVVTSEKEAAADLERMEDQLRQAHKMEAVGRLAGGVAHDFNNLLTAISGFGELGLASQDPARVQEALEEIVKAARRGSALTGRLLAFSRRQPRAPALLDINETVTETGALLRRVIGSDVELAIDLAPRLHRVEADGNQLQEVLMNLAVNARDAMPGGGRLSIGTANTTLDGEPAVALTIADTGCGMDDATLAQAFEPFFTTKAPGQGTGLGLAAVHGVVQQSGGRVDVTSRPGDGTTFEILLPAASGGGAPAQEENGGRAAAGAVPRGTERILLVEDDPAVRGLTRRFLTDQGYSVVEAANGREALDRFEQERPDLLITDASMPEMSGLELRARLTAQAPGLPVVFVSGYSPETLHESQASSSAEYLQKPFSLVGLGETVRRVLDRRAEG